MSTKPSKTTVDVFREVMFQTNKTHWTNAEAVAGTVVIQRALDKARDDALVEAANAITPKCSCSTCKIHRKEILALRRKEDK